MDLVKISEEIRDVLEVKRKELELTFIEEDHIYYMRDVNGKLRNNYPSVSKIIKNFYVPFDADTKALQMAKGDVKKQKELLEQWKASGEYSTNMGSRVHYLLETETIARYGSYKDVREPIFDCDHSQIVKSDKMIEAGNKFLDLMAERNENYHDTALGHYFLQLPLYGKLLIKMLQGTKYGDLKLLGCVVVLLKDDGTFEEYKVPFEVTQTILKMDINKYIRK